MAKLVFEKLIKCVIRLGYGLFMNSREKAEDSTKYFAWC